MKIVSSFDPMTGRYAGEVILGLGDISPLEPEVYLIPGNCTDVQHPPYDPERQIAAWDGMRWSVVDVPVPAVDVAPPPPGVVRVVSMRQARLALLSMGLLDDVETAMGMLPEPQQTAARIEWEYATEVRSNNDTVELLAETIGLDLDQLFEIAEGIQ